MQSVGRWETEVTGIFENMTNIKTGSILAEWNVKVKFVPVLTFFM